MKKKNNIVIVGGGSTWSPGILKALTKHQDIFPFDKITLYDIDEKRQEVIGKFGEILFIQLNFNDLIDMMKPK